jgi:hypothetical protein
MAKTRKLSAEELCEVASRLAHGVELCEVVSRLAHGVEVIGNAVEAMGRGFNGGGGGRWAGGRRDSAAARGAAQRATIGARGA